MAKIVIRLDRETDPKLKFLKMLNLTLAVGLTCPLEFQSLSEAEMPTQKKIEELGFFLLEAGLPFKMVI